MINETETGAVTQQHQLPNWLTFFLARAGDPVEMGPIGDSEKMILTRGERTKFSRMKQWLRNLSMTTGIFSVRNSVNHGSTVSFAQRQGAFAAKDYLRAADKM
jgi:hypothetical protein